MVNSCANGFSVVLHYWWEGQFSRQGIDYRKRPIVDYVFTNNRLTRIPKGEVISWESTYVDELVSGETIYGSLAAWHQHCQDSSICSNRDYFTVDPATRSRCFSPSAPTPPPSLILRGTASPPPPPPRKMCGCDCNTIASIIAEHMAEKQRLLDAIKEHIDSRAVEQLQHINKMLQDIDMDLDLQPVIDEVKRVEKNLWNGINGV
jgi:hypothetical protein